MGQVLKVQAKVHDDAGDVSNTCNFQLTEDFFFFSEQYATCRAYTSKWDVRQDGRQSREDPACSTKKVCAFMRVDAGHFPEFNCYQCAAAKSL